MTCIWGIEMGKATILLHCSLVLLQIILLRRNFKPVNLLQVAVGIVFGYFTTFCNWCVSFLPEPDGDFNEDYCKWCYADGTFKYTSKEQLIDFCVTHMASEQWPPEQVRAHMEAVVPQLKHWKK